MPRRGFAALVLLAAFGCHPSPGSGYAVQELPDEMTEEDIAQVDPEIAAAQRACEDQHDVHACTQSAEYWEGENGRPFDPQRAFHYAASGCDGGDGLACAILGNHYQNGIGLTTSHGRAIAFYQRSCDAGTGLGCDRLGEMFARGHGVDVDRAKAKTYRDRAHDQWLAACLGSEPRWCPHAAASVREGEPTAHELHQRACDQGVSDGCIQVLHDQLVRPTESRDATMRELDQWCSRGQSAACEELASAYDQPNAPRAPARSIALTQRACVLGKLDACVRIGALHESERGVPKDDPVARRYFDRACTRGSSQGCLYLAQDTLVTSGDAHETTRLARRGCEMGSVEACTLAAKLFAAFHVEPAAVYWATAACRMGASDSCLDLLARDRELPKSVTSPVGLYRDACNLKIASACTQLPKLVEVENAVLRGIVAAVAKQDVAAFAKLAANAVDVRGLWFNDPDCTTQFYGTITLTAAQHPAFLRCLAKSAVRVEPAPDHLSTSSLAYEPDMKLAIDVRDGVVQRIQASSSSEKPPPRPAAAAAGPDPHAAPRSVGPMVVEAHRIFGEKEIMPDLDTKNALGDAGNPKLTGSFKLCITEQGAIANVTMLKSTGSIGYDRKIERGIYGWRYTPFMLDGEPAPVCTAVTYIYTQFGRPTRKRIR